MSDAAERMRAYDAKFLDDAHPDTPMNVGGFITFHRNDDPLTIERLRSIVDERLTRLPRFRQRIDNRPGHLAWIEDDRFELALHVDEMPFAGDDHDLTARLARSHATPLDPTASPWKISLVPQGATGGSAIWFRASHALVDGLSAMHVMRSLFDGLGSRGDRGDSTVEAPGVGGSSGPVDQTPDAVEVVQDVWHTLSPGRAVLEPERYDRALSLLDGWLSMLDRGQHGMPRFAGNGVVRTRVGLTELPSRELRRLRLDRGIRFDELGLSIVGGALARRFAALGGIEDDARIRTLVPIGGATSGHRSDLGNRSSYLLIALPIGEMTESERLTIVGREVAEALDSGQHRAASMSLRALQSLPRDSATAIGGFMDDRRFVDLVVSCIPGPRRTLRLGDSEHDVTFPILPITRTVRVAVGIADIAGRVGVSVTADATSLPELDFVLDGIRRTAASLVASAG